MTCSRSAESSTGSGCSPTGCTSPGCATHGCARSMSGDGASSTSDSPECPSIPMFDSSEGLPSLSTSSPADSPARAPAPLASGRDSATPKPFCGARWPEPLASFDPDTCFWRTWRTSLLSTMEPSGERCSGTWPRSGTTLSGIAYQREPSAPRTSVTGSSPLLPTPNAWDGQRGPDYARARRGPGREASGGDDLTTFVAKLLPTPHGMPKEGQARRPGPTGNELGRAITLLPTPRARVDKEHGPDGQHWAELRPTVESLRLLPTPVEGDSRNSRSATAPARSAESNFHPRTTLSDVVYEWSGATTSPPSEGGKPSTGLRLSPWFLEWMIGAPHGWSDPGCLLSATEFKSRSDRSSVPTSLSAKPND